jgi:hypothetical protein
MKKNIHLFARTQLKSIISMVVTNGVDWCVVLIRHVSKFEHYANDVDKVAMLGEMQREVMESYSRKLQGLYYTK